MKLLNFVVSALFSTIHKGLMFTNANYKSVYVKIRETIEHCLTNKKPIDFRLCQSLIAIEDKRFFSHYGIDIYAVFRALYRIIFLNKLEGASTIEQQLVRGITNNRVISVHRKILEIFYSVSICRDFNKEEIIAAYVHLYKFSNNKSLLSLCTEEKYNFKNLTTNEINEIAARFKYPTLKKSNYIRYLKRVRIAEIATIDKQQSC